MKSYCIVTETDMDRLSRLARALQHSPFRDRKQLDALDELLDNAEVRSADRMPRSVVRVNSRILIRDLDTDRQELYRLVFPEAANISKRRLSVLAPLGIAVLGHRQGDIIEANVPGGIRRFKIQQVAYRADLLRRKPVLGQPLKEQKGTHETGLAA